MKLLACILLVVIAGCAEKSVNGGACVPTKAPISAKKVDVERIRGSIREHAGEVRQCYDRFFPYQDKGKVVLEWSVNDGGCVSSAMIASNTFADDKIAGCLLDLLSTWKFPNAPEGDVIKVDFPFLFLNK